MRLFPLRILPRTRRLSRQLRLHQLEDRTVPALVTWDGGLGETGGNFNWNNPVNWSPNGVPGLGDDVTIGPSFAGNTIVSTGNVSINSLTSEANLNLLGGTFSIAANSTIAHDLTLSATLAGTGDLTIDGEFHWTGGTLTGSGVVTVPAGAALSVDGDQHFLDGRRLLSEGTATWANHHIWLSNGAEWVNAGSLAVQTVGEHWLRIGSGSGRFSNTGTLTKAAGSGPTVAFGGVVFDNAGVIDQGMPEELLSGAAADGQEGWR